jgi:inner membrane protein
MPTIMSHAAVPLATAIAAGRVRISVPVVVAGMALAMLPDADVAAFKLGIAYADTWGHRGATHSLAFAALTATVLAASFSVISVSTRWQVMWPFFFTAMASHGLLDSLTSGGLGAALLWPFSDARIFAPVQPIRVSPIGAGFFSLRGVHVMLSELRWIWLPLTVLAALGWKWRKYKELR